MLIAVPRQLFRVLPLASALTLASVASSLTFASETESDSVSANDATARVLKLNISSDGYPPYLIIDQHGNPGGIAYDVISRIADRQAGRRPVTGRSHRCHPQSQRVD